MGKDGSRFKLGFGILFLFLPLSLAMIWPQQEGAYPGDTITFCFRQTYFGTKVVSDAIMKLYIKELNVSQEKYLSIVEPLQEQTMCAPFYFNSSGNFTVCGSFLGEQECRIFEVSPLPFNVSWKDGLLSVTFSTDLENVTVQFGNETIPLQKTYPGLTLSRKTNYVRIEFDHHTFERNFPRQEKFEFPYTIIILVVLAFLLLRIFLKR